MAGDKSHRISFARDLMAATIFVMGEIEGENPAKRSEVKLKKGAKIILRSQQTPDGKTIVPFFSSLEKLQDFIKGNDQVKYLSIPTTTLFEIAKGSTMVLNSGSRVRGEFSPADVERLIRDGTGKPGKGR
jgi:hypothetical protein